MNNHIHISVMTKKHYIFQGMINGVELATVLYRELHTTCIQSEQDAEEITIEATRLTEGGHMVPFEIVRDGRTLTMDDLAFGDIRATMEEIGPGPLYSITLPVQERAYATV